MTTMAPGTITALTARLLIGALLLGAMIVMGIAFANRADRAATSSVQSLR
jgi:hypothetical protein